MNEGVSTIDRDCVIDAVGASYHVQTNPSLIIVRDKATGSEEHFAGDEAEQLWSQIRGLVEAKAGEVEKDVKELDEDASSAVESAKDRVLGLLGRLTGGQEENTAPKDDVPKDDVPKE